MSAASRKLERAELAQFLTRAKRATYAAEGPGATVQALLPGTKQLEFGDAALLYRDVYAGTRRFVGQEIVYHAQVALWSMAYAGGVHASVVGPRVGAVYAHVRGALRELPSALPLRGPASFEADGLRYVCDVTGDLSEFHGVETVTEQGALLYELRFAGGLVT